MWLNNYLSMYPQTRVNDFWGHGINFTVTNTQYKDQLIDGAPNSKDTRFQVKFYNSIALDIVPETVYNYPYPFISEKTLRPIASKRMFIIVGAPGILKLLHTKGFRSFPKVIDESYDDINDPVARWHALESEILKFTSKSLEEVKEIFNENLETLEHNFQTLKSLQQAELKLI